MSTVLEEAAEVVEGARQADYGHPALNHACTAAMARAYLQRKHGVDVPLDAEDICVFNILQKLSRQANYPKRDNLVDAAGYIRNVEMVRERGG